jgi:hypothetical protein
MDCQFYVALARYFWEHKTHYRLQSLCDCHTHRRQLSECQGSPSAASGDNQEFDLTALSEPVLFQTYNPASNIESYF